MHVPRRSFSRGSGGRGQCKKHGICANNGSRLQHAHTPTHKLHTRLSRPRNLAPAAQAPAAADVSARGGQCSAGGARGVLIGRQLCSHALALRVVEAADLNERHLMTTP